jgi:ATP-dependent DNA helicase DinG
VEKGDVVVHNHPGGNLRPSEADIQTASHLGSTGVGFYIIDNAAARVYVVTEPVVLEELEPIELDPLVDLLRDGGRLQQLSPTFEERQSQLDMLASVGEAFNEERICAAEAGTGVGKSFAYLIPALAWAAQNQERVVVSTATINLQQQIYEKDIPQVRRLLGAEVKAALLKGRSNYLCLNRLEEAVEEDSLFDDSDDELSAIKRWAKETASGSRSDLPFPVSEQAWSRVNSDPDACSGLRCRRRGDCFLLKARKQAADARLLVVNHHLLFSDLSLRLRGMGFDNTAVLPAFHRLIFDEAHSVEDSATSYFSESFSRFSVLKHLGRLSRQRRGRRLGLLPKLGSYTTKRTEEIDQAMADLREQVDTLETQVLPLLAEQGNLRMSAELTEEQRDQVLEPIQELQSRLLSFVELVQDIVAAFEEHEDETSDTHEIRGVLRRLGAISSLCESFRSYDSDPEQVYWIERRRTGNGDQFLRFTVTPLEIGEVMRDAVYEPYKTVIFTSATLTVNDRFDFWATRVGLDQVPEERQERQSFPSPFPYAERVLVGVPTDAPLPHTQQYLSFLERFVRDTLLISEGRALVLFTSYHMLEQTYRAVKPALDENGITAFRQGEDDRGRLLTNFTADTASVLFATESFWQGVDAPGETLQVVILCRLPFRVPTHPIAVARMEAVERAGGNPFRDLSLPEAVMKLKQGFGRLMRHKNDSGVVLITDVRVVQKSYGEVFLASLPETARSVKPAASLLEDLERFLYR